MDELKRVNRVDSAETQSIRRLSAGILERRPWVWLRWSRVSGTWTLVPQISLEGAYELYRRHIKDAHFFLEKVDSFTTPKGTPVISVIVSLVRERRKAGTGDDPEVASYETVAFGGQDGFITQTTESEERKLHGTAAALHKAIRNCIINYLLLHHGPDVIYDFVNEAIRVGRAAIIERDGSYRFVSPEELSGRPQQDRIAEEEPAATPPPQVTKQEPQQSKSEVLRELSSIPPETLNQWLLIYSEIIQKDPHSFSESEWTDFVKWTKMPITQRQIDDLVQQATTLYRREYDLLPEEPVDRREVFRYIARKFLERGQRITELTQPQYHELKQKIQNELWKSMEVVSPEEEVSEEDFGTEEEDPEELDEFPF
ncbi:MAG: hypothetical protein RQ862_01865 [Candidatus Caldarchaeales archaeon]|nr:hypothetical protein [Candidatus Caldarchaeales archaeon]